MFAKEVSLTNW